MGRQMAKNHIKPTSEELQSEIDKAMEQLDAPETTTPPETVTEPTTEETTTETTTETPAETVETPTTEETTTEESNDPDYKKKFSESSREAQKLAAKNKVITKAISSAGEIDEVPEQELQEKYTDWDLLSDTEKKLARESAVLSKRFNVIHEGAQTAAKIEKWGEDVDKWTEDPRTLVNMPELEGKLAKFKAFATLDGNHGTSLDTLAKAFLFEEGQKAKPKNTGGMFPTGSGGPNIKEKPADGKISFEESLVLKENDYNKWKGLMLAGKIREPEI